MAKVKINYVDNKKLQEELVKYQQAVKEAKEKGEKEPKANDFIGKCIYDIATNYAKKGSFFSYTADWKTEMICDGIENCVKYGIKGYNTEKYSNPLTYFTEIIHWSFVRRIKREKKEQYKKLKNQINNELVQKLASNKYIENTPPEAVDKLIGEFEAKMNKDKNKKNTKKGIELFLEMEENKENV
jgi:hypothetical protein